MIDRGSSACRRGWFAGLGALATLATALAWPVPPAAQEKLPPEVSAKAARDGTVVVLVGLKLPWKVETALGAAAVQKQRAEIGAAQEALLRDLRATEFKVIRRYEEIPAIALEIGPEGLAVLEESSLVANVLLDRPPRPGAGGAPTEGVRFEDGYVYGAPSEKIAPALREHAGTGEPLLVLVGLNIGIQWRREELLAPEGLERQRAAIKSAQDSLLRELTGTRYRIVRVYRSIPAIALELDAAGLTVLEESARVTNVLQDRRPNSERTGGG
ncbi:MAG TPA: hypothetical protein VNN77_08105 [candidate division Zixibacteria bacterium]|nr:hypothetical protein [candidate division Zixibacteria bacterium]